MIATPTPQQYALVAQMIGHMTNQLPQAAGKNRVLPGQAQVADDGFFNSLPNVNPGGVRLPVGTPMEEPASVFGRMQKSLPAATRSTLHSHQAELIKRFMQNQGVR